MLRRQALGQRKNLLGQQSSLFEFYGREVGRRQFDRRHSKDKVEIEVLIEDQVDVLKVITD